MSNIKPLPNVFNDQLLKAGLTEFEASKYTADRLMIANYLKPTANVLEIGSRPSVSIFVELNKVRNAKHIVVDNDVGDRDRLNQLIVLNEMTLKVMPIEEFVDIYSYDAVIIEESEGDTAELLRDLPLDKIGIIITSEMARNHKSREEVSSTLSSEGFEKKSTVSEITSAGEERVVDVYEKPINEIISEDVSVEPIVAVEPVEPVEPVVAVEPVEPIVADEKIMIEVKEKTQEVVAQSQPLAVPIQAQRRFVGRRRPMMRMAL